MPIKSCSRCGLKVLVDATAAATDNYMCPRCTTEAKPAAAASAPKPGGKRPSVKVTCPYCGAQFSGTIPSRPAKGGCPVCRKELVLLPDGDIQAASSFNLSAWQKDRGAKKTDSSPPPAAPPQVPEAADPLGGSTILDMGGPPPRDSSPMALPSLDEPTMAMPGGLGGETMLGMGSHEPPPPAPSIDEPPAPERAEEPELPPDLLGGATILDMGGHRATDMPTPEIDEPPPSPDLLSETMPGMDRPPTAESPVEPPTPPPIPEDASEPVEASDSPTVRDYEEPPAEPEPEPEPEPQAEPEPEPESIPEVENSPASVESAPEIPMDLGGETMLGMGGNSEIGIPTAPVPSIEEPPPEAVPILAKDMPSVDPSSDVGAPPSEPGQAPPKPYVYQPIPRLPRKPPGTIEAPTVASAPAPEPIPMAKSSPPGPLTPPPPPSGDSPPRLGSDFRMSGVPTPPQSPEPYQESRKPAGPKTTAAVLPRASHSTGKLILAWAILLLPLGVGFGLHSMKKSPSVENVIKGVTNEVKPGYDKVNTAIRNAVTPAAEVPPEPPK